MEGYVNAFINYLAIERGLAKNTLESYGRDLKQFQNYMNDLNLDGCRIFLYVSHVCFSFFMLQFPAK